VKRNFWISAKEFSEIIRVRNDRFEDIDDDKYWKLGLIYFNKEDPAVFVEKRFGTGWVLNLARFKSYALLAGSILCLFTLNIALMLLAY
jgi:uncharacterized membrane protein